MSSGTSPENNTAPDDAVSAGSSVKRQQRAILVLIMVSLTTVWGYLSWQLTESVVRERSARLLERERESASDAAASIGANVGATLAYMRGIPKVLSKYSEIQGVLSAMGSDARPSRLPVPRFRSQLERVPEIVRLSKLLESALSDLDVEQLLVVNAAGDCIASAGYTEESSPVGLNYRDRKYFQQAVESGVGRQFAVGRTTNTPGIYYSSAVFRQQSFIGVVAVRINVSRLSRMGVDKNVLITDENNVVVVTGNPAFYMKATADSGVANLSSSELESLYQRPSIRMLSIEKKDVAGAALIRLEGSDATMLEAVSRSTTDLLSIHVIQDVSELWRVRSDGKWIFALIFLAGTSLLVCILATIIYLRRRREHLLDVARFNAELVKMNEILLSQARFDALTGCGNRRYFLEELGLELQRVSRFEYSCCLAMLDIDHFKSVNDMYGHAAGDALLKHFVQIVTACLRSSDLIGRLGGEEFALLMPQTSLEGAVELAERIRRTVERSSASSGGIEVSFTVSIGVVQWMGGGDELEAFVARADDAMYAAKRSGRNRVCAAPTGGA